DGDGLADCADPDCAGDPACVGCPVIDALDCGGVASSNNGSGPNAYGTYSCVGWDESGPEVAYTFTAQADGQITMALSAMTADLDLFILGDDCDPAGCLAFGNDEATFPAVAGQTYTVLVDGYGGVTGDFTVTVTCGAATEICDDGADDDGDGLADCADPDCAADPACATGSCCVAHGTPGCEDPGISACVCAQDDYCCDTEWDASCVGEVDSLGCGTCGGAAEVCDDGADNDGDGLADCADPDCGTDPGCLDFCPGYTGASNCCQNSDPCGWAADGYCDCEGTCAWDAADCGGALEICDDGADNDGDGLADCADADCAADPACLDFCPGYTGADECCQNGDPCGWADDAYCDCNATCAWDVNDCAGGTDFCPGYTGASDCCQITDPCGYASDGTCDCDSTCGWDVADCT
ncbi:MAG TPA: PPC domain-containing protein, partial [Myxococcota bacterium]|nr:PPC domain-containing protein [Myxococcota bacterium]